MTIRWLFGENSVVDLPDHFEKDSFGAEVLHIERFVTDSGKTIEISQMNSGPEDEELIPRYYFLDLCHDKLKENCSIIEAGQLQDIQVPNLPVTTQAYYLVGKIQESVQHINGDPIIEELNVLIATFTIPELQFDIVITATEKISLGDQDSSLDPSLDPDLTKQLDEYKLQLESSTNTLPVTATTTTKLLGDKKELLVSKSENSYSLLQVFFSVLESYEIINFHHLF